MVEEFLGMVAAGEEEKTVASATVESLLWKLRKIYGLLADSENWTRMEVASFVPVLSPQGHGNLLPA
jgi:hypothetical protein